MTIVYSAALEHDRAVADQRPAPSKHAGYLETALAAVNAGHRTLADLRRVTGMERTALNQALCRLAATGRVKRTGRGEYRRVR